MSFRLAGAVAGNATLGTLTPLCPRDARHAWRTTTALADLTAPPGERPTARGVYLRPAPEPGFVRYLIVDRWGDVAAAGFVAAARADHRMVARMELYLEDHEREREHELQGSGRLAGLMLLP
jgi:hypothetical protein